MPIIQTPQIGDSEYDLWSKIANNTTNGGILLGSGSSQYDLLYKVALNYAGAGGTQPKNGSSEYDLLFNIAINTGGTPPLPGESAYDLLKKIADHVSGLPTSGKYAYDLLFQIANDTVVDTDSDAWYTAVLAAGGTANDTTRAAVKEFSLACKTALIWDELTRVNLMCGDQLAACLVPLKVGGGNATETNTAFVGGDYTETTGLKGDGATKFLNTGWNPLANGASITNFHISAYVKGTEVGGASRVIMGNSTGSLHSIQLGWLSTGTAEVAMLGGNIPAPSGDVAAKDGHLLCRVLGNRAQRYFRNGVQVGEDVGADGTFAALPMYILARNLDSVAQLFSLARFVRGYSIGLGFTSSQALTYFQIMQTFQQRLGRAV